MEKKDNPNAFKLWISADVLRKYFKNTNFSESEINQMIKKLNELELKARVELISSELRKTLPHDFPKALKQLQKISKAQKLKSFELWPMAQFIQTYGLQHIDLSIQAMYELTSNFTAEFCIRPFINVHGDIIYKKLSVWKNDSNEHIRRWISEGTRPRLPWGEKLQKAVVDPRLGLSLIENLKFDSSLYVRKSVSNHLNDISKDHPDLVVKTLLNWKKTVPKNYQKEFQFLSQRALRGLIKAGHPGALKFIGIKLDNQSVRCLNFKIDKTKIKLPEKLELSFSVENIGLKKSKYIIDYVIHFKKANGGLSPKVFKLKTGYIEKNETLLLKKTHHFKPITTRVYHSGQHKISLKVNGSDFGLKEFELRS